jgi:acid phosphatase
MAPTLAQQATASPTFPTPIEHVVVVMDENQNYTPVMAEGPFEAYLARTYATATNDYSVSHGSVPAYEAATSGIATTTFPNSVANFGDLADASNVSWAAFEQSMPALCDTTDNWIDGYDTDHNPLLMFDNIVHDTTRCDAHDLTWSSWTRDVNSNAIPNYSFVTPNVTNDDHNASIPVGDAWLQGWLSPLINDSAIFSNTAFVITYDEDAGGPQNTKTVNGSSGGQVYTAIVSPFSRGLSSDTFYNTYSLLTTAEWLLGIAGGTLGNDSWTLHPPMKDLFSFPSNPSPWSGVLNLDYAIIGATFVLIGTGLTVVLVRRRRKAPPDAATAVGQIETGAPPAPP